MSHAHVRFKLPDGREHSVAPGGIIGRLSGAALSLRDPRISEAHALVSLRGDRMRLVALRGRLIVGGKAFSELELAPGLEVELAPGLVLRVTEVVLPDAILGLRLNGELLELNADTHSLVDEDARLCLVPGYLPMALAWIASSGDGWILQRASGRPEALRSGAEISLGTYGFTTESVRRGAGVAPTLRRAEVLEIVCGPESTTIHSPDRPALVCNGHVARILYLLAGREPPILGWKEVVEVIWRHEEDPYKSRKQLDDRIRTLRKNMEKSGLRTDLLTCTGDGNLQLLLYPGDTLRVEGARER